MAVVLISKAINARGTRFDKRQFGYSSYVSANLQVSEYYYGQASTGRSCIHGFRYFRGVFYGSSYYVKPQYFWSYNGFSISSRAYDDLYGFSLTTLCLAQCPDGTYFNGNTCIDCNASMPNCTACTSASKCVSCPAPRIMNYNSDTCECPPRYFLNSSTDLCDLCPFDCWTCDSNGSCLSCSPSSDFRQLNGSRCSPLPGYYETNTSMAGPCLENCLSCSSSSDCSECFLRFLFVPSSSSVACQACPFDCLTCDSSGNCLSCSPSDDRELSGSRCIPLPGHF